MAGAERCWGYLCLLPRQEGGQMLRATLEEMWFGVALTVWLAQRRCLAETGQQGPRAWQVDDRPLDTEVEPAREA